MNLEAILNKGQLLPGEFVYSDLNEVPLDVLPEGYVDYDNSVLENNLGGLPLSDAQLAMEAHKSVSANFRLHLNQSRVVIFPRELKLQSSYMRGKDVLALQRALARAGVRKWGNFTGIFGAGTKKNIQVFQSKNGLMADGGYGYNTHKKLSKYYDAYGTYLMSQAKKTVSPDPRSIIASYAIFGYNQRHKIHYTQSYLRMYGVRNKIRPPKIPIYEDCSSYATWCYWGAGLPDPNKLGYNGTGYTGTLALNGSKTTIPRVGDLAFYGRYPYGHVVIYIGNGNCISFGSEIGPLFLNVYYRSDFSHFRTY